MRVYISKNADQSIVYTVDIPDIKDATANFNLSIGTRYNPIPIEGLMKKNFSGVSTVGADDQIIISVDTVKGDESVVPQLTYCRLQNVGRTFNKTIDDTRIGLLDPWDGIFQNLDKDEYIPTPDGSLYIAPLDNQFRIKTQNQNKLPADTFVRYSIVFSLFISINNSEKKHYFFVIDPLIRVTSNPPPVNEK